MAYKIRVPTGQGYEISAPEEGKLWRDNAGNIFTTKGGQILQVNAGDVVAQKYLGKNLNQLDMRPRGEGGTGEWDALAQRLGLGANKTLEQEAHNILGIDISKLPEYNLGDLKTYGGLQYTGGGLSGEEAKQLYAGGGFATPSTGTKEIFGADIPKVVSGANGPPVDAQGNPIPQSDWAKMGINDVKPGAPVTYVNGVPQPAAGAPGAPGAAPATTIQPGQRIPGPSYLTGMKETDLARTTGANIYKRDLALEQSKLGDFAKLYGKQPATDTDWRVFHEYAYEGKIPGAGVAGALPETNANMDGKFLTGNEDGTEKPPASEWATIVGEGGGVDTGKLMDNFMTMTTTQLQNTLMTTTRQLEETAKAAKEAEQKNLDTLTGELKDASGGFEDKARALITEMGLKDKQAKITGILEDMAKVKESLDLGMITEQNRITGMSIIGRRQNTLQEQGAARLGALKAIADIYDNDYDLAKATADTIFNAFTSDKTAQINALNKLIDLSDKKIISLGEDEKSAINAEMNLLQGRIDEIAKNKDTVLDLIIKNPQSAQKGKVSLLDTPEEAVKKMMPFMQDEIDKAETMDIKKEWMKKYPQAGILPTDSFETAMQKVAPYKLADDKAAIAGLDPDLAKIAISYSEKFDSSPIVKQFNEVQNKKLGVDALLSSDSVSGPQDVALIYDFMKALDPTSVVRESEYAMGAQSGNLFLGWAAQFNGYFKNEGGKLPENVKTEFQNIINQRYGAITQQYDNLYSETARKIQQTTGTADPALFLTDYKQATGENNIDMSQLTPLNKSYSSPDALIAEHPEYYNLIDQISKQYPTITDPEIMQIIESYNSGGGFNQDLTVSLNQSYPQGSTGGQCTTWLHKVADFPSIGDSKSEKIASVQKYGFTRANWSPKVGDIIVTNEDQRYGHTAMITSINSDGTATLAESNYYQKSLGPEKVSYTRKIALNSSKIYGAIRPKNFKIA